MADGRDVFTSACRHMRASAERILRGNELDVGALHLLIVEDQPREMPSRSTMSETIADARDVERIWTVSGSLSCT